MIFTTHGMGDAADRVCHVVFNCVGRLKWAMVPVSPFTLARD